MLMMLLMQNEGMDVVGRKFVPRYGLNIAIKAVEMR